MDFYNDMCKDIWIRKHVFEMEIKNNALKIWKLVNVSL